MVRWLTLAAEQGNEYAQFFLDHMDGSPSLFASATRLLHHMGRIFQEQAPPSQRWDLLCGQQAEEKDQREEDRHGPQAR